GDGGGLRMVIEIETQLAAALDIEIAHPAPAVRQSDLEIVMTGFQLNNANVSGGRAFGTAIDTDRHPTRVGCDQNLAELNFFGVRRGRSANQGERDRNHGSDCEFEEGRVGNHDFFLIHRYTSIMVPASLAARILA